MGFIDCLIYSSIFLIGLAVYFRQKRRTGYIAFFHPYCNAGGGGERVLWCAIRFMQKKFPNYRYVVFTGDVGASKEQILLKAHQRFGIDLDPNNIDFCYLRLRRFVEADIYPRITMLAQAIAGGILAIEALYKLNPDVMIDSMGYPLSLPVFKIFGGARVVAYVHYPTISCDMVDVVESRKFTFNNSQVIVDSNLLTAAKLYYYKFFAFIYWLAGKTADRVMANGSWTQRHMTSIWSRADVKIVFPPCDVKGFLELDSAAEEMLAATKVVRMISVSQIRPEKNHRLQLEVLKDASKMLKENGMEVRLCIAGGCRNADDERRVNDLKVYAEKLGVTGAVEWRLNVPLEDLNIELSKSLISIHTMHNEHFGISVVEAMAAGTIILANDSGGPQMDIVQEFDKHCVGYLATTREEYCHAIVNIVNEGRTSRDEIRKFARQSVKRFDEQSFDAAWGDVIGSVVV